jgi:hypothetical protein
LSIVYKDVSHPVGLPDGIIQRMRFQPNNCIPKIMARRKCGADEVELATEFPGCDVTGNRELGFNFDLKSGHSVVRGCAYAKLLDVASFAERIEKVNSGSQMLDPIPNTSDKQLMLCLWAFFRDIHSHRDKKLDVVFNLPGHWFSMAYRDDSFEEGFMAKVWDSGLRVGTPGIYLPIGIIIALIRESVEWEYAMAIDTLRMILDEMHSELEMSEGALILSEEGNMESALCIIRKGGNVFVTDLEAIQSDKSPLPLPDGKEFWYRFLSLIKELVQIMGKKELQVR